jgi:hypothetical protein
MNLVEGMVLLAEVWEVMNVVVSGVDGPVIAG